MTAARTVGVDASNLRQGGGVTHLLELLRHAAPAQAGVGRVRVWGARALLDRLPERPWLERVHDPALEGPLARRTAWQRFSLGRLARGCDLLFAPGGTYAGGFRPFVTMSRNLLPFQPEERARYGAGVMGAKLRLLEWAQTSAMRRADGVIFLTRAARAVVEARTGPLRGRVEVIPHGVSEAYRRPPREEGDAAAGRPLRVLYVSHLSPYKHQDAVVRAVGMLLAEGAAVELDLVGPPGTPGAEAALRGVMAQADPSGAAIRYRGALPYAELPGVYHAADVFVFASTCENMPNILLEAMASGLPVACSDREPMPEVLGGAGLYFDPEQPAQLADALRRLAADAELRARCARDAYARALAFSWERCARETFAFLAGVAAGAERAAA